MRKLANDFPLDAVVFVLPDVVVLLLPPPQPAAITASPAHSAAAVTSRFQEMLRFKIDLPVFTVPLSAGCILTDVLPLTGLEAFHRRKAERRRPRSSSGSGSSTTSCTPSRPVAWRMRPSPSQNAT